MASASVPLLVHPATQNCGAEDERQESQQAQQNAGQSHETKGPPVGLAFSGGGIRSAALCSGVLRRMLQKQVPERVKTMYLSCVSGGGYTGTAYLDWKLRKVEKGEDDGTWHDKFFDHMRRRTGHMCNWQKPMHGLWDSICLVTMVLVVVVIMPCIIWFPYAFPLAYAIDFLFGEILRAESVCVERRVNITRVRQGSDLLRELRRGCEPPLERVLLFVVPLVVGLVFFLLSRLVVKFCYATRLVKLGGLFRFISVLGGVLFFMTFLPWFIDDYLSVTRVWTQVLFVVVTPVLWFFFPIIRNYASLSLIVYLYAYVVSYRVFKESKLGIEYSEKGFNIALYVSAVLLWIFPITGAFHQGIVHAFNRWRLVKAFYHEDDARTIQCVDIFPGWAKYERAGHAFARGLSRRIFKGQPTPHKIVRVGDLNNPQITPTYICNVTVNDWKLDEHSQMVPQYTLLTLTPTRIEIIDERCYKKAYRVGPTPEEFEVVDAQPLPLTVNPNHIGLARAMATSAAALALDMGSYDSSLRAVGDLQAMLGLGMGDTVVSDLRKQEGKNCCWKFIIPLLVEFGHGLALVTFPVVYFIGGDEIWLTVGVLVFFILLGILSIIAVQPTGSKNPGKFEKVTRWFIVHVFYVRFLRNLMSIINKGPSPPALLRLSDGGHFENLALLPLLKKKLKRIVVVNGGNTPEEYYGEPLLSALKLAREKLHCSFTGMDGRDVSEDLRARFIEPHPEQRSYKFKVQYYSTDNNGVEVKDGDGEIMFIAPRKPAKRSSEEVVTWADVDQASLLEEGKWGRGPELTADEFNHLTWCCCECCHADNSKCQWLSGKLCGSFPQHTTANQFFTPSMFTAYHREGYYACHQAEAADFLLTEEISTEVPHNLNGACCA